MKTNNIKATTKNAISGLAFILALISVNGQALAQSKNEVSFYLQGSFPN